MKKVFAVFVALAVSMYGSIIFAAEEEPSLVRGNVEIYGMAKLSVDFINTGGQAPADTKLFKVSSNSSRFGLKGSGDLGNGLSAIAQVELGINMDGTTSSVVSSVTTSGGSATSTKTTDVNTISFRNTFAGLRSERWGTLLLGTYDTPYKISTGKLDPFLETMGDYNSIISSVNGKVNFDLRFKDTVVYLSPVWGGLLFMASTSTSGTEASNSATGNPQAYSTSAAYTAGPLYASLAYEIHRNGFADGDKSGKMKNTGTKAGLGFTAGDTRIGLVYESLKDDTADSANSRDAYYLAVSHTLGKETIKLAYGFATDGKDPATKTGATLVAIGVDHAFSKWTTVYALYAVVKNNADATYGIGTGGAGGAYVPGAGEDPSVFSVGLNQSF
jgi:predicted porin